MRMFLLDFRLSNHIFISAETEATRAEPDVWLYAWIRFETTMKSGLDPFNMTATFESFDSCDPSDQARVCEAVFAF